MEKLNNYMKDIKDEKNKEIKQIKNEICEQNKQNKKLIDDLKDNMKKIFFSFTELKVQKIKNEKNKEYFKDIMNKYYNFIILLDNSYYLRYKSSYDSLIDFIFDEIAEKNGKKCDEILEFTFSKYDEWRKSNWNAFLIRNSIHRMFYSGDIELNEKLLENIYEELAKSVPKLKEMQKEYEIMNDIKSYYKGYKIYYIIEVLKKKMSEITENSEETKNK